MKYEYAATKGACLDCNGQPYDPEPPCYGENWELRGVADYGQYVVWYWQRAVEESSSLAARGTNPAEPVAWMDKQREAVACKLEEWMRDSSSTEPASIA